MIFYKHHIGDYAAATAHLSVLEDGAYSRLLRIYYRDEKPLPVEVKAVQRLAGARSRDERNAVQTVLEEFFELEADGWHNKRADEEIGETNERHGEAGEKRKHEAERKRRYRQRRADVFDRLRDAGIVPPFDTPLPTLEAMLSRGTGRGHAAGQDGDGTANQTPDTINQDKSFTQASSLVAHEPAQGGATSAGRACLLMRQAGCPKSSPSHPDLLAALAEGVTPEALADTVREGLARSPPVGSPFAWAIATARGRREEGAKPIHRNSHGASHAAHRPSLAERAAEAHRFADECERERAAKAAEHL